MKTSQAAKQKLVDEICWYLGAVYQPDSGLRKEVNRGLMKLPKTVLSGLWAMAMTSSCRKEKNLGER